jgi:hypothetical protein
MKRLDDLDPEVRSIAKRAQKLRESNSGRIGRLESMGVGIEVVNARLEHFMNKLIDAGVLTDDQVWAINLEWEESLAEQILGMEKKVEAVAKKQREMVRQQIATPQKGIILPNGAVVKPKTDE